MSLFMDTIYRDTDQLTITLCLEEDSILIGKKVLEVLEYPKQIQLLINEEAGKILLQPCTVTAKEAIVVPEYMKAFEMSGHSLLRRICKLTGWTDNLPRTVFGGYMPAHQAIVFDLNTATPVDLHMPLSGAVGNPS